MQTLAAIIQSPAQRPAITVDELRRLTETMVAGKSLIVVARWLRAHGHMDAASDLVGDVDGLLALIEKECQ